jgi:hypothetical protein
MTGWIEDSTLKFFTDATDKDIADLNAVLPDIEQTNAWLTEYGPQIMKIFASFGPANQAHLHRALPVITRFVHLFLQKQRRLGT